MRVRVRSSTDLWLRALYYLRVRGRQATAWLVLILLTLTQ